MINLSIYQNDRLELDSSSRCKENKDKLEVEIWSLRVVLLYKGMPINDSLIGMVKFTFNVSWYVISR